MNEKCVAKTGDTVNVSVHVWSSMYHDAEGLNTETAGLRF